MLHLTAPFVAACSVKENINTEGGPVSTWARLRRALILLSIDVHRSMDFLPVAGVVWANL